MKARDAGKALKGFQFDMEFHSAIVAAAGNAALLETHRTYNARLWRVRFLSSQRKVGMETTRQQHLDIVAAITARDAPAAHAALQGHLKSAEVNIKAVLEPADPTVTQG